MRGSAAFRRAVWAAASERGLAVKGYSPTRGEVAVLAQSFAPDGRSPDRFREQASTRSPDPSLSGAVVAMGEAPYRHDASNSPSFFVTLRA